MQHHVGLGDTAAARQKALFRLIHQGLVQWGGNKKDKIYGLLSCRAGRRMKVENRVFFSSESEAIAHGYRPCGACMRTEYEEWKRHKKD
ncbi:metal-binding protein [Chitinophaga sp. Cy-1792]|nr:metal-binding protein [Chitinophaga sp. Cy-1792]